MIEINLDNKDYLLPENWEEVPEKNRLKVLELVFATAENGATYHVLLRTLLDFSEKNWNKFMRKFFSPPTPKGGGKGVSDETMQKNAETLQELLDMIKWMWQPDGIARPFEYLEIKGVKYYLFEAGFKSMSFGELTDAYIHAHSYIKQLEEGDKRLHLLLATVCRSPLAPKGGIFNADFNGDIREPYNAHYAELAASVFESIPVEKKVLVLVYFLSQLKEFLSYYDIYDDEGREANEDYPGQGYIKNQHLLSEKGIFGNMAQTKAANVHDVFLFLEENKKDIKEQIRQQKTNDPN